jgi:hypothetical protein
MPSGGLGKMPEFHFSVFGEGNDRRWGIDFCAKDEKGDYHTFVAFSLLQKEWDNLIGALQMTTTEKFLGWDGVGYHGVDITNGKVMIVSPEQFSGIQDNKLEKILKSIVERTRKNGMAEFMTVFKDGTNVILDKEAFLRFREQCLIYNSKFNK